MKLRLSTGLVLGVLSVTAFSSTSLVRAVSGSYLTNSTSVDYAAKEVDGCSDSWHLPATLQAETNTADAASAAGQVVTVNGGYEDTDCTVDYYSSDDDTEYCEFTLHLDVYDGSVIFTNANGTDGDHTCYASGVQASVF